MAPNALQSATLMISAGHRSRSWRRLRGCLGCCTLLVTAAGASAQIYVGVSESGSIVLSNHSSEASPTLYIAGDPAPASVATAGPPPAVRPPRDAPAALAPMILETAHRHSLPPALLTAVIAVESGFDPRAVSPKGAKGLMQLMPDTARRFGVKDAFAVQENLRGGATYLRELLRLFEDNLPLALAAYNAGEGAVLRAGRKVPAYRETEDYVARVLAHAGLTGARARTEGMGTSP